MLRFSVNNAKIRRIFNINLAARGIIPWNDIWKYLICLASVVLGITLLFFNKKSCCHWHNHEQTSAIILDGSKMHKIDVTFGKQQYSYSGQRFEGAEVHNSFGFTGLDLRGADIMDGAVITVECCFSGVEIRVDKGVCVNNSIETSFAGVDCECCTQPADGTKTLYLKGHCSFGGIEIK